MVGAYAETEKNRFPELEDFKSPASILENQSLDSFLELTDPIKIREALDILSKEELKVEAHLNQLLNSRSSVEEDFSKVLAYPREIQRILSNLKPIQQDAEFRYSKIEDLHFQAKKLSLEKIQLDEAERLVEEGSLLLESIGSLDNAIKRKEIESAGNLVNTCMKALKKLKNPQCRAPISDADKLVVLSVINPLSAQILELVGKLSGGNDIDLIIETSRSELVELVSVQFDLGVANDDTHLIGLCFKLFPLLGEHITGLDKYSQLLALKLSENYKKLKIKANIEGSFALRLGNLLDSVAYLIDTTIPVVEKYYGLGEMVRIVERLQLELDKRVVLLFDSFEDERQLAKLLAKVYSNESTIENEMSLIKNYKQKSVNSKLQESVTPSRTTSKDAQQGLQRTTATDSNYQTELDDLSLDFKQISKAVNELAIMAGKTEFFFQYLSSIKEMLQYQLKEEDKNRIFINVQNDYLDHKKSAILTNPVYDLDFSSSNITINKNSGFVEGTQLNQLKEWLISLYLKYERFSLKHAMNKILSLDDVDVLEGWDTPITTNDEGSGTENRFLSKFRFTRHNPLSEAPKNIAFTSSSSGDVFYILQTSLERACLTQRSDVFESLVIVCIKVIKSYYIPFLESFLQPGWVYPSAGSSSSNEVPNPSTNRFSSPRSSGDVIRKSRDGNFSAGQMTPSSALGSFGLGASDWKQSLKNSLTASTFGSAFGLSQLSNASVLDQQKRVCVGLNNIDVSISYLSALCDSLRAKIKNLWSTEDDEAEHIKENIKSMEKSVTSLLELTLSFSSSLNRGISALVNQALKQHIRQALKDSYRDIKYVLDDEEFSDVMSDNLFLQRLFLKLDCLLKPFKGRLTANNYESVVTQSIDILVLDWQRAILQSKFSTLGGIVFENDVNAVRGYFEKITTKVIAPKFSKLVYMSQIMASPTLNKNENSNSYDNSIASEGSVNKKDSFSESYKNLIGIDSPSTSKGELGVLDKTSSLGSNSILSLAETDQIRQNLIVLKK
ncbi:hypothetical protein BB560_002994 [Smittium megazygosporum]|uniref:COG4 transport protein middle alpha-helical bundle domain-containing protein n=1 Tax=Smittium megazygosporum TaxID=133381 RepID=A0A2T9ZD85_9FUNG|nr:hypothetical protein BB560_002994 [Smittium megazygosporum]